jgi:cyclopropane-fatty-acyl-phospholipid synthase
MVLALFSRRARLASLRAVLEHLAEHLDARFSVRLWDGSVVPLGPKADPRLCLVIRGPGVVTSLLRRPTLDNLLREYARGRLDVEGADFQTFAEQARMHGTKGRLRNVSKLWCAWKLLPLALGRAGRVEMPHRYADEAGIGETRGRANKDFVQFHYDVSNDFYELFLGDEMQYSCNYFTDRESSTDDAAADKMEMICRKLRLRPGERLLDIGCGWGGLICYAARRHGVVAHGITLSEKQLACARERVRKHGLEGRVTVELRDANELTGEHDKVASIGMFEHLGIDNYQACLSRVFGVMRDRGLALVQMICRGAKPAGQSFRKSRPEHRLFRKYIFPGGELGNVGDLVKAFEASRFEVHDVEGWRDHYALTLKRWSHRLSEREQEAVRLVGPERFRLWVAYMTGMSLGFADGTLRLYQVLATKHAAKGPSGMPCTRGDLYARPFPSEERRRAQWDDPGAGEAREGQPLKSAPGCD